MTFKEKLRQEQPNKINHRYCGGCKNCPDDYGYEKEEESEKNCRSNGGKGCEYCWNREMPETEKKQFTKADLKDGMIVRYRNDDERIFFCGKFYNTEEMNYIEAYKDNLKISNRVNDLDIMKVYEGNKLVWEREETKKMTHSEIEAALGYKFEYAGE